MIIDNLYITRVAILKAEFESPRSVDCHRPLTLPVTAQSVKPNRIEWWNIVNRPGNPQNLQSSISFRNIHPAELGLAVYGKAFRRAVGEAYNHSGVLTCLT